jgi:hypothetical protein
VKAAKDEARPVALRRKTPEAQDLLLAESEYVLWQNLLEAHDAGSAHPCDGRAQFLMPVWLVFFRFDGFRFRRDTRALSPAGMSGGKEKSRPHAPLAPMRCMPFYSLLKYLNGRVVLFCSFHVLVDVRGVGCRVVESKCPPQKSFFSQFGDLSVLYRPYAKRSSKSKYM